MKEKVNENIGEDHVLTSIDTPLVKGAFDKSDAEKIQIIKGHFKKIMETLGLDLNDDSLAGSPERVAKMYVTEIFSGLNPVNEPVIGLSKINRIVQNFAKRPQVQERLTVQIVEKLKEVLKTDNVACVVDAKHLCVNMRGVRDTKSSTITSRYSGVFNQNDNKTEFLKHISLDSKLDI